MLLSVSCVYAPTSYIVLVHQFIITISFFMRSMLQICAARKKKIESKALITLII